MIDVLFLLLSMTEFALTFSLRSPALCTCLPTSYIFSSSVELPPSLFLFLSTLGIPSLTPLPSLLSSVFSDFSSLLSSSPLVVCVISRTLSLLCTIISLFPPPAFLCSAVPSSQSSPARYSPIPISGAFPTASLGPHRALQSPAAPHVPPWAPADPPYFLPLASPGFSDTHSP